MLIVSADHIAQVFSSQKCGKEVLDNELSSEALECQANTTKTLRIIAFLWREAWMQLSLPDSAKITDFPFATEFVFLASVLNRCALQIRQSGGRNGVGTALIPFESLAI